MVAGTSDRSEASEGVRHPHVGGSGLSARRTTRASVLLSGCVALGFSLSACLDDGSDAGGFVGPGPGSRAQATPPPPSEAVEDTRPSYREDDFVESDSNRDPFRNYARPGLAEPRRTPQRTVLLPETPVADLRLTAIISGQARSRAMLVDKVGVGHVATRGDYVGQSETLSFGGDSLPIVVNWRVDRIRGDHVILARSDPSSPGRPPLTRVIALHSEEE